MSMANFNMSELGIFIGVCSSALVAIVIATQKSKCSKISCCGFKCERRVDLVIAEEKLKMTGNSGLTPRKPYLIKEGKELNLEKKPVNEEKVNEEKVNEPQNENN